MPQRVDDDRCSGKEVWRVGAGPYMGMRVHYNKTQLCSGKRLLSFQGYSYPPLVNDVFQWRLPDPSSHFRREVSTVDNGQEWRFELWSPYSVQLPYYVGIRSNVLDLRLPASSEQRRYDGHLGKFDPTIAPQYYNKKRPWLAFIPTTSQLSAFDWSTRAEYVPIIRAWQVDKERPYRGCLRVEFVRDLEESHRAVQSLIMAIGARIYRECVDLWDNHPVAPLRAEFEELRNATTFEQAVDTGRQIQRGIFEKAPPPIALLLEPQNSEYDHVALRLNGGLHTLHDASLPLPGIAFRPVPERLLSGSQKQWGPLVQEEREARSESPDRVSIPYDIFYRCRRCEVAIDGGKPLSLRLRFEIASDFPIWFTISIPWFAISISWFAINIPWFAISISWFAISISWFAISISWFAISISWFAITQPCIPQFGMVSPIINNTEYLAGKKAKSIGLFALSNYHPTH
ncbi:hypothetical protein K438DRAFT_1761398 [Mycena galopus ATCC 62051]|nr:hypothetical protein K438DRAFT_1761398 [Mycena galopus ATCC 62051]